MLLISYTFPPKEGIGGRRWAKFCKHLVGNDFDVHVIHQKARKNENSNWIKDVTSSLIKTYPINTFYPISFGFSTSISFVSRIAFHFWKLLLSIFYKGVIFDRTLFWRSALVEKVKSIVKSNNINYIIVTIPPFLLASHVLRLKKHFPKIKFVIDYRDPWTENRSFHGFKNISSKKLDYEKKLENAALKNADLILHTTDQMKQWNNIKVNEEKCKVLENGYDKFEVNVEDNKSNGRLKSTFLLAGSIYVGLDYIINPFINFIEEKEKSDEKFIDNFDFLFIGTLNNKFENLVRGKQIKSIKFLPKVSRKKLNEYYNQADYFMMFSAFDHGFNFNTKFYEYLPYKKPIIHFGPDAAISEFLLFNGLGRGVKANHFDKDFNLVLDDLTNNNLVFNDSYDVSKFEVEALTKKLIGMLNDLMIK